MNAITDNKIIITLPEEDLAFEAQYSEKTESQERLEENGNSYSYFNFWSSRQPTEPPNVLEIGGVETDYNEAIASFSQLYGQRIVDELLVRYSLIDNKTLTQLDLELVRAGIAARVRIEDLHVFYEKLQMLDGRELNDRSLLEIYSKNELKKLIRLVKTKPFESLTNADLNTLLRFFRTNGIGEVTFPKLRLVSKFMRKDRYLLQTINRYHHYDCHSELVPASGKELPPLVADVAELAISEYFSRGLAYASLEKGMILPSPTKLGMPVYFTVESGIDKEGFASFLLAETTPQLSKKIHVIFRGTQPSSRASISHNLAKCSGDKVFRKNQKEIFENLKTLFSTYSVSSIEFNGHSQGGAIAQNGITTFLNLMNEPDSPFQSSRNVGLLVWNSPSILEKHVEDVKNATKSLSVNPRTIHTKLKFVYNIIHEDIVHKFGEGLVGSSIHSLNVSRQVLCFKKSASSLLAPHLSPILTKDNKNPLVVSGMSESLYEINKLQKMIKFLEVLIQTFEQKEIYINSVEDRESFFQSVAFLNTMIEKYPSYADCINQSKEELILAKKILDEEFKEELAKVKANSKKMSNKMNLSTYSSLSTLDQYATNFVIGTSKEMLYPLIDPTTSNTAKGVAAAKFTGTAALSGAALYGAGALVLTNPVSALAVGATVAGAMGTHYVVNQVKHAIWGEPENA